MIGTKSLLFDLLHDRNHVIFVLSKEIVSGMIVYNNLSYKYTICLYTI